MIKTEDGELTGLAMATDADFVNNIPVPNTASDAMQNYCQLYSYDQLGNLLSVQSQGHWTRDYYYETGTNRLLKHDTGSNVYSYDAHGNMLTMPHLTLMKWDYRGNLSKTVSGTVTAHYCYDASGNRLRKIALKAGGIREERIYIGSYELYRKTVNGTLDTERQSSFVTDDTKRIAIVDTRTTPTPLQVTIRYQYDNHLGSACLELDGSAQVISYEEYHPFGTTSYRASRNATETALKRYKYVGKERDEDTGLYYYGARYYAAWLCRFVSVDPLQFKYPHYTPYQYAGNKPISFIDLDGLEENKETENPIHVYYSMSLTGKQSNSVLAQYVTTTNRKGANVSLEIFGTFTKIGPLLDFTFDLNSAITEKEITPLAQDAIEGVMKTGSYILKKASEDNVVGQNKELFKSYSKNLNIGGKILSKVFSAYNIYNEVNSLPTKSESLASMTISALYITRHGEPNIINEGLFRFNESYNGKLSNANEIVTKTFKGLENYFSAFDFTDPEQIEAMKSFVNQDAAKIINDALKFSK